MVLMRIKRTNRFISFIVTEASIADATVTREEAGIASYWLGKSFRTGSPAVGQSCRAFVGKTLRFSSICC
jgi:hypothetical protein